jgi:hypothetical protein
MLGPGFQCLDLRFQDIMALHVTDAGAARVLVDHGVHRREQRSWGDGQIDTFSVTTQAMPE